MVSSNLKALAVTVSMSISFTPTFRLSMGFPLHIFSMVWFMAMITPKFVAINIPFVNTTLSIEKGIFRSSNN